MLEDFDISKLEIKSFGGAEIGPKYVPKHVAEENAAEDKTGAVTTSSSVGITKDIS